MTAVALFDLLAGRETMRGGADASSEQLDQLAGKLIEASLADLARVSDYEREFGPTSYDSQGLAVASSIFGLYEEWAGDAEQVLERVKRLGADGHKTAGSEALEDAYGRVRARLRVSVAQIARSMEQVGQGRAIAVQELRNELLTRNRA